MNIRKYVELSHGAELVEKSDGIVFRVGENWSFIPNWEVADLVTYLASYHHNLTKDAVTAEPESHGEKFRRTVMTEDTKPLPDAEKLAKRSAAVTSPLNLGNPFLASSAPVASSDGKQRIQEIIGTDLAAEATKAGVPVGSTRTRS